MAAWGTPPAAQRPGHGGHVTLSFPAENPAGLMQMQFGSRYRRCRAETDRRCSHALAAQRPHPLTLKVGVDVAAPEHDPAVTFVGHGTDALPPLLVDGLDGEALIVSGLLGRE